MKPILIPATLLLLALHPLQAQDKTNAPAAQQPDTNAPVLLEAVAPATTNSLFGRSATPKASAVPADPHSAAATNVALRPTNRTQNSTNTLDYRSFKLISDRNIFDANRSAGGSAGPRITPKVTKVDTFKLLGTVSYEKGRFAFFDGSSADLKGTVQTSQKIADYKIAEIGYSGVKLVGTNGTPIDLTVGMQMKRVDDGPWSLAAAGDTFSSSSSHESTDKSSDAPSGSNDAENEVMKRLMQKRAKELNK